MAIINRPLRLVQRLLRFPRIAWIFNLELLLELFVASNLAVLAADIVLAHSVNQFRKPAEYIPLYFSAAAPVVLVAGAVARWRWQFHAALRDLAATQRQIMGALLPDTHASAAAREAAQPILSHGVGIR